LYINLKLREDFHFTDSAPFGVSSRPPHTTLSMGECTESVESQGTGRQQRQQQTAATSAVTVVNECSDSLFRLLLQSICPLGKGEVGARWARAVEMARPFNSISEAKKVMSDAWICYIEESCWITSIQAPWPAQQEGEKTEDIHELMDWMARYEQKFGFPFICFSNEVRPLQRLLSRFEHSLATEKRLTSEIILTITQENFGHLVMSIAQHNVFANKMRSGGFPQQCHL
jgi:hypothetical protein